jgi:hypothetical protein
VAAYGGISLLQLFFVWMGALQKLLADCFYCLDFKPNCFSWFLHHGCYLYATNTKRIMELPCSHGIFWLRCSFIIGSGRFGIDYLLTEKLNYET